MKKFGRNVVAVVFAAGSITLSTMTSFAGVWQPMGNQWAYQNDQGQYTFNQLIQDHNALYYIGADGLMKTGLVSMNNAVYDFAPSGEMRIGWVQEGNEWYYMQPTAEQYGQMTVNQTRQIDGKMYYFDASGKMAHDSMIGQTYYGADGAAISGADASYVLSAQKATEMVDRNDSAEDSSDSSFASSSDDTTTGGYSGSSSYDHDEYVERIFELVNKERKKAGRKKLVLNDELNEMADERAAEIVDDFSHDGAPFDDILEMTDEDGNEFKWAGENIAMRYSTADSVMRGWMNSTGHRKNILNKKYTDIGIGVYQYGSTLYYVQLFAGIK